MKKTNLWSCGIVALLAAGIHARADVVPANSPPTRVKPTVILERNSAQGGGRFASDAPAYQGDPKLHDAFRTLHPRLQTMLVSSGRVNVKPEWEMERTLADENTRLCSYTLVQGKIGGDRLGRTEYDIGINLQAWNYKTGEALPELTRTLDLKLFETSAENAFKETVRRLAFITLEALSPVEILEKEGTDVSVNAGGEILRPGDLLLVKKGLRSNPNLILRVVEVELNKSICEIVNKGETENIRVGDRVVLQAPGTGTGTGIVPKDKVVIGIGIPKSLRLTTLKAKQNRIDRNRVNYPVTIETGDYVFDAVYPNARQILHEKIRAQNLGGLQVIAWDGKTPPEDCYELIVSVTSYMETHTRREHRDTITGFIDFGYNPKTGKLAFFRECTLDISVILRDPWTNQIMGDSAIPVKIAIPKPTMPVFVPGMGSMGHHFSWNNLSEQSAREIAREISGLMEKMKNKQP